jgi:hypothetical protein
MPRRKRPTPNQMTANTLCTQAWLLVGITRNLPGILELNNGQLVFTSDEGCIFDVPLSAVRNVDFPWHYFGGGVKFSIGPDNYRLSFVRPNDAFDVSPELLSRTTFAPAPSVLKVFDIGDGRRAGKIWKSVFSSRTS